MVNIFCIYCTVIPYIFKYNVQIAWGKVLLEKLTGFSASQQIPNIVWNAEVLYRIHNSPPPAHMLR